MSAVIELKPNGQSETVASAQKCYVKGDYAQAGAIAELYLREHPDDAQALAILSAVYKQADRTALAYLLGKRASELRPDRSETWVCHGFAAQSMWRMDQALACYRKALQRAQNKDQKALYNNNLCSVYLDLGQFAEAEKYADRSLEFNTEEMNTRHNKGLCLLARRKWDEAWGWYSASIGSNNRTAFRYMKGTTEGEEPLWDGKPFPGILAVYGEQGLGDEICAASAVPDIAKAQKSAGGRLIIDCDKRLAGLFKRSFPDATVHGTRRDKTLNWPDQDRKVGASIACFEVLKHFRTKAEDFPGTPYLTPCPDRVKQWNALKTKPRIGIAWTGGTWKNAGSFRTLPLDQWKPIFDAVDAEFVSLQYKDASKEIEGTPVKQYAWATLTKDYDDTAALVASCDLVIGMQTSVCHLAGALGVPTWILLPKTSQWRYGEEYTDLPWYGSSKLYRQKGDAWPISRIVADLKERVSVTLISEGYRAQQEHLHATTEYGTMGKFYGPLVSKILEKLEITHLLDYGCGAKMGLAKTLSVKHKLTYQGYDPGSGLEELMSAPIPAQMVCCIDVLEHIEPEYLDNVLNHLQELTEVIAFVSVHTGPAAKILPDGRNAHLTQEPIDWWLPKLTSRFDIQTLQKVGDHSYYSILYSKQELVDADGTKITPERKIVFTA